MGSYLDCVNNGQQITVRAEKQLHIVAMVEQNRIFCHVGPGEDSHDCTSDDFLMGGRIWSLERFGECS